jgi:hypothetical protein
LSTADGRTYLDLWSASQALIMEEGVRSVEVSGVCTACDLANWYSHRGEHGRTGRLAAMVSLRA